MIKGNHKDLMELKKFVKEVETIDGKPETNPFSLQSIIPMPKELEGTECSSTNPNKALIAKYGFDNWYAWCCRNWGTKWNTYNTRLVKDTSRTLHYEFTTAWSPPFSALATLSTMFPKLRITDEWNEEGGMSGTGYFENGEITKQNLS